LAAKVEVLEAQVSGLRSALSDREAMIVNLQQENADLQTQVDKLSKAVNGRDKRIRELERQVADLTERLNAMNGDGEPCD
jgi:chromosome segregation ATPase